jgi:tRNA nucleotidyltransferase (CCA-adding enzyme)
VHRSGEFGAAAVLRLIERCDAIRRPERFAETLLACECDARGRLSLSERPYPQRARLTRALLLASGADTAAIAVSAAARGLAGPEVGKAIHEARANAIAAGLEASSD